MKTKQLLPLILLVCATCTARAHLIDLTPGGFNADNGLPEAYFRLVEQTFCDSAAHGWFDLPEGRQFLNGWVSKYGILNGADYFSTNLFSIGDTPFASIAWNLAGQPDGYWLTMIYVAGRTEDGTPWEHIYGVSGGQRFEGEGIVTANGLATISQIGFYGLNIVPDGGTTLLLFGLALVTFSVWKQSHIAPKGAGRTRFARLNTLWQRREQSITRGSNARFRRLPTPFYGSGGDAHPSGKELVGPRWMRRRPER